MARSRRTIIDSRFQDNGQVWDTRSYDEDIFDGRPDGLIEFYGINHTTFSGLFNSSFLDPNKTYDTPFFDELTVWDMGIVSLGPATEAQIAFSQTNLTPFADPDHNHAGFPGEFIAVDVIETGVNGQGVALIQTHYQFGYAFGAIDFDKDPIFGYDQHDVVPAAAFFFGDDSDPHQVVFEGNGFTVFGPQFETGNRVGYDLYNEVVTNNIGAQVTRDDVSDIFWITGTGLADNLVGSYYIDTIRGGDGNDTLDGFSGPSDNLFGYDGDDILISREGNDLLDGGMGTDTASYRFAPGGVSVTLATTTAQNTGSAGLDTLQSIENLIGSPFNDILTGDNNANVIEGGVGSDQIDGGGGNDILNGGSDPDLIFGGTGNDTIDGAGNADEIHGGGGHDTINGGLGLDLIYGDAGNDTIHGNNAADVIYGGDGNDTIFGDTHADTLFGDAGDDHITGGTGKDISTGGSGADTFHYNVNDFAALRGPGADRITDFVRAQGDKIDLSAIDAAIGPGLAGDQAFSFIGAAAFSGVPGQLHYVQDSGNTYVEGDRNGDMVADFALRIDGLIAFLAADFIL